MTDIVIEGSIHDLPFVYGVFEYLSEQEDITVKRIHVSPVFQSLTNSFKLNSLNNYKNHLKNLDSHPEEEEAGLHEDIIVYRSDNTCKLRRIIDSYRILEKLDLSGDHSILYIGSSFNQREKCVEKEIFNGRKDVEMVLKFNERGTQCSWKHKWTKLDEMKRNMLYMICITFSYLYILYQRYFCSSIHVIYLKEVHEFLNKCLQNLLVQFF